jgi:Ca2+/Na+ antiporter
VVVVWCTGGWFRKQKWWMCLFTMMLGWIVLQCVYLTYWLEKAACTIGITPGAMGTILGAAGTSIPNLLCSMYVARKGHGVMACTEVWGSNVWLIFVCLGLPWGIYSTITGKSVTVQNSNSLSIWMCCVYGVYIIQSIATNWTYRWWVGWVYNLAYVGFIIFVFVNESVHFTD